MRSTKRTAEQLVADYLAGSALDGQPGHGIAREAFLAGYAAAGHKRTGAAMNRGGSKQDYQTDPRFIEAVKRRFGHIDFDLAASPTNMQAPRYFSSNENALEMDWTLLEGLLWLNPPFDAVPDWAAKCAETMERPHRCTSIAFLTPASVSTNWFADYVRDRALVLAVRPRLVFVGETQPYPRDMMLSIYGERPGFDVWRWM